MRFEVLGPLRISHGGESVPVTSGRQRSVLAMLIATGGRIVTSDALIEAIWGDDLPSDPHNTLQHAVAQVRKMIEPDRDRGDPASILISEGQGYRLALENHESDAEVFDNLVGDAGLLIERDPSRALELVERSLGMWRGDAYADVADLEPIRTEIERLNELRYAARVLAARSRSSVDGPASVISELETLVAEFPLREALWAQLMTALYRSGRQADALRVYRKASNVLADELGIEPSTALRELEESILMQDPSLDDRPRRRPAGTIPGPKSRLIGRERELKRVLEMLASEQIVTLLGPGGSGKTRLAIEAARAMVGTAPEDVWFVRLDELNDDSLVPAVVGSLMGMREDAGRSVTESLARHIGSAATMLVLDNCEHLIESVAEMVSELVDACPNLTVLTTSQQPLEVRGERRVPLPPLALPGEGDASPFEDLEDVAAIQLFLDRARAIDPDFRLSPEGVRAVANIVAALDGMPLAIELAAARTDLLTPGEIAVGLRDRFDMLSEGPRDAPKRQRSLRSAVEWSYALLDASGQRCLSELAVFVGSFGADAASAVLDKPSETTREVLGEMVRRSLLARESNEPGTSRFRMLETLRQFGAEQLEEMGDAHATRTRHARFYRDRVLDLDERLTGRDQMRAVAELVEESENLRNAMAWSLQSRQLDIGVAIAARAGRFWDWRGNLAEARTWYSRFIGAEPEADTPYLGTLFAWYAYVNLELGDEEAARDAARTANAVAARSVEAFSKGAAASIVAVIARRDGDPFAAIRANETIRAVGERDGVEWFQAWADNHDTFCHLDLGRSDIARESATDSSERFERLGDRRGIGWAKIALALVALHGGDLGQAMRLAEEAVDVSMDVSDGRHAAWALEIAAKAAASLGDATKAESLRDEAVRLLDERGVPFSPWRGLAR